MKKYTYVTVSYEGLYQSKLESHRKVIDEYAAQGWRYVDHIPIHEAHNGQSIKADLIFEKDVEE